ncbi:MAG: hypothetical protein AMJ91_07400 [candidate division Zixibacteria bacterium SM23_73_3]|nr:MAG: hypothetical protein AMJ91_07400 [candidate division Zixibacteria bacterium SM23_73_3]
MEKMIGFCGLDCSECPAFIATKKDDDEERKKVAQKWNKEFKANLKPEDINCDGCLIDSERLFNYCKVCEIRKCGKEQKVENCAYCDDYACDKLIEFFTKAPEAKTTLDGIRAGR